jgi:hypothetical protein
MPKPQTVPDTSQVFTPNGRLAAFVERTPVGGGTQIVTVDGKPEERVHPSSVVYHARLISVDLTQSNVIKDCDTWDEAVAEAEAYAARLDAVAEQAASIIQGDRI